MKPCAWLFAHSLCVLAGRLFIAEWQMSSSLNHCCNKLPQTVLFVHIYHLTVQKSKMVFPGQRQSFLSIWGFSGLPWLLEGIYIPQSVALPWSYISFSCSVSLYHSCSQQS